VTDHGLPLLTSGGQPIVLSATDTDIAISRDGTVSSENGALGRFRVVRFDNPQTLRMVAAGLMASDGAPEEMNTPRIVQGMLEGSNVEPIVEMERMISVHRAYESTQKLITGEHERMRKMMEVYAS
jgi:flagellar basal-body rod protein FlgF